MDPWGWSEVDEKADQTKKSIEWGSPIQNEEADDMVDEKAYPEWSGLKNKKS